MVIKNDTLSLKEMKYLVFDRIVISPRPGHSNNPTDFSIYKEFITYFQWIPILVVCLIHQGIKSIFGYR
ncbi:MAG: glutamine amidotransferase-related protein [Flavobacteriales bacterium AspAUS03]